ncbi:competence type IV pilus minor pilin ComGE [Alkalihalobacterium bogoriense]|uniref:competence type IV pilus minor pilin ComGE n=1 Tax=Alkalihalobacterium bogoriense TaxID=246272 RepID=UPI00047B8428|nr:competence type IV pilus minor pilin ComGE [Alkalihalobacterium bogoriense]
MKKCSGFTLMEVVMALSIVMMMTSFLLPVLLKVYQENRTIQEQTWANVYVHKTLQEWLYDEKTLLASFTIQQKGTTYEATSKMEANQVEFCLTWIGRNSRSYVTCQYAKKT